MTWHPSQDSMVLIFLVLLAAVCVVMPMRKVSEASTLEDLGVEQMRVVRMASRGATDRETSPKLPHVFVLTVADRHGEFARARPLLTALKEMGVTDEEVFKGLDYHRFRTEADLMAQKQFPTSRSSREQWLHFDIGYGPTHRGNDLAGTPANGALACALGHHRIWEMVSAENNSSDAADRGWAVILEDDAMPVSFTVLTDVTNVLRRVPPGSEIVPLDDRHCQWRNWLDVVGTDRADEYAMGSTAYAVTVKGAEALLAEPFEFAADHWLNMPVVHKAVQMFALEKRRSSAMITRTTPQSIPHRRSSGDRRCFSMRASWQLPGACFFNAGVT
eukprot:CAMPEP_0117572894 /NCGR_PEP_ID=MMETSP0784-20121206/60617_1 /TAXON_ID=39447 /ORGANISM="" /LENGTH=330 /DNA_ID=CAMNT_0005371329 /DNA_START=87 /DNA_END=1077 /DNA_ORIENTATION=+